MGEGVLSAGHPPPPFLSLLPGGAGAVFILSHPSSVPGSWSCSFGHLRCSQFYCLWTWLIVRQFLKTSIPFQFSGKKISGKKIKLSWFGLIIRRSELLISSATPRQKVWKAPAWRGRAGRLLARGLCELGIAWSLELCPQRLKKKNGIKHRTHITFLESLCWILKVGISLVYLFP